MSIYLMVLETKKLLHNLDGWLVKTVAYAGTKKFDPNVLLQSRLSPDMLPFVSQIQIACDSAKYMASRAVGKDPPAHPDKEQTIDEIRQRIASVISYLDGFAKGDFEGTDARQVRLPRWEGKWMSATDYVVEHALPNFFFHLTTAYAILRHNGVDVGKSDYLGSLTMH